MFNRLVLWALLLLLGQGHINRLNGSIHTSMPYPLHRGRNPVPASACKPANTSCDAIVKKVHILCKSKLGKITKKSHLSSYILITWRFFFLAPVKQLKMFHCAHAFKKISKRWKPLRDRVTKNCKSIWKMFHAPTRFIIFVSSVVIVWFASLLTN